MISDKKLEQLCLVIVIVGIIILFFSVQLIEPIHVNSIDESLLGREVSITGIVDRFSVNNSIAFITMRTNESIIQVVAFNSNLSLAINSTACVIGEVTLYKNMLEIVVKSLCQY